MSEATHKSVEDASIIDVVGRDKETVLSAGAVRDSVSQSLSTLSETHSAARAKEAIPSSGSARRRLAKTKTAGIERPSGHDRRTGESPEGYDREIAAEGAEGRAWAQRARRASVKGALASGAVHELDDTPEFEGAGDAYDRARALDRIRRKALGAGGQAAPVQPAKAGAKAKSAKGAAKGAKAHPAPHGVAALRTQAQAAKGSAAVAQRAAGAKAVGAAMSSALAPLAGVIAGIVAFILAALVLSQLLSAIFGFWTNEANKRSIEGLPPYITYEMVEAALECQEAYGHPAGCTIAQIIAESGQGDHMSQLATRDHNLFGIKWAPSFASCPEVQGKSSWQTGEVYDGQSVVITAYFTVFESDVDCIGFRSRVFLRQNHFANNAKIREAIASRDSDKMAEGLKEGGWATSPVYVDTLKSIMDAYGLRRFDSMTVSDWRDMDAKADKIVAAAESQLGVPYVWGGSKPGVALDCSGLTQYCYAQAGISIGHNTEVQASQLRHVPLSEAKPGDILYRTGHVAIYTGGDQYIHEPQSGDVCKRSSGISYFSYALTYRAL